MGYSSFIGQEESYISALERMTNEESSSCLSIFLSATSEANITAVLLGGMLNVEKSMRRIRRNDAGRQELLQKGAEIVHAVEHAVYALTALKDETDYDDKLAPVNTATRGTSLINLFTASVSAVTAATLTEECADQFKSKEAGSLELTRNQVHANPDDGIAWLAFGKQLVLESARLKKTKSIDFLHAMESARIALSKSSRLLHDRVTDAQLLLAKRHASDADVNKEIFGDENISIMTNLKAVIPNFVDAAIYAECVALHAVCVDSLRLYQSASSAGPSEFQSSNLSVKELQQALLIDPENLIARKGLGLKC
jgi:hypothetical protein